MSDGKLDKVSHFDSKAQVEDYIRTLPIVGVYFMPGFYMQNMLVYMRPKKASLYARSDVETLLIQETD